jgi:rubrerythrin
MANVTDNNLALAFAAESRVAACNSAFALKAQSEGYPLIALLFRAVAEAESIHARRYLGLLLVCVAIEGLR